MNFDNLSDGDIESLLKMPKRVTNPGAKWSTKPGHRQKNYTVKSDEYDFRLYLRQNLNDEEDFSCGLSVIKPDGQPLTLIRFNGSSHVHGEIAYHCHIHRASERAMQAGKKPERHAEKTDEYTTLEGALYTLVKMCSVSGLTGLKPDQPDMFDDSD